MRCHLNLICRRLSMRDAGGPANSRARDILDKFILYVGYRTVLKSCYCHNHTPQVEKRFGTMLYQPLGTAPLNVFPAEGRICSVIKG